MNFHFHSNLFTKLHCRECVRNLDLWVQVHPGGLWISKQGPAPAGGAHSTRGLKISGFKRSCPKDLRVHAPAAPVLTHSLHCENYGDWELQAFSDCLWKGFLVLMHDKKLVTRNRTCNYTIFFKLDLFSKIVLVWMPNIKSKSWNDTNLLVTSFIVLCTSCLSVSIFW